MLVDMRSKLSHIEPKVPGNTKIAREEASKSWDFFDEKGSMLGLPMSYVGVSLGQVQIHVLLQMT